MIELQTIWEHNCYHFINMREYPLTTLPFHSYSPPDEWWKSNIITLSNNIVHAL